MPPPWSGQDLRLTGRVCWRLVLRSVESVEYDVERGLWDPLPQQVFGGLAGVAADLLNHELLTCPPAWHEGE